MVSQSFAKNFGLYNERCGTFNVVCSRLRDVAPRLWLTVASIVPPRPMMW